MMSKDDALATVGKHEINITWDMEYFSFSAELTGFLCTSPQPPLLKIR